MTLIDIKYSNALHNAQTMGSEEEGKTVLDV